LTPRTIQLKLDRMKTSGLSPSEVGAFEAKNTLGSLLDRVENGEEIVITRHGKPVARLVPNAVRIDRAQVEAAFQRIRERARRLGGGKFDWEEVKALRDEGRR
jgi:prevent-host-death family protein